MGGYNVSGRDILTSRPLSLSPCTVHSLASPLYGATNTVIGESWMGGDNMGDIMFQGGIYLHLDLYL